VEVDMAWREESGLAKDAKAGWWLGIGSLYLEIGSWRLRCYEMLEKCYRRGKAVMKE
jgi:hypothetical protein